MPLPHVQRHARSDHWLITLPLAAICILDTMHQAILVDLCYTHLIAHFADLIYLEDINL